MEHNLDALSGYGAKTVVTSCAECYKTWKVDYPRVKGMSTADMPFEVIHITELIAPKIEDGSLALKGKIDLKVAWHDPCNLGRMAEPYIHWNGTRGQWGCLQPNEGFQPKEFRRGINGVYDEPRDILASIAGIEVMELKRHHEFS